MHRAPKITAQVANGADAYIALMHELGHQGESSEALKRRIASGKTSVAEIWHTSDHGATWNAVPWRRAARVFVSPGILASWPPEWVNRMWLDGHKLGIEVRDDWGWDSRWDPIWSATWSGDRWRIRFTRLYRSNVDGPIVPPSMELDILGVTAPPVLGPFR